ncbi:unnamed protein product [Allacma fusca]|uniref:Cytochrome P450 n=1 Tax=Allacma fusca TaxID=39272 RepID=A0A8J2JFQ8_9HEXA|nr:unnamed protein product [Allacma fusca]
MHLLAKKYGDVISLQMGLQNMVVIGGYETVKAVVLRDEFLGRYSPPWLKKRTFDKDIGILFGDVPIWKDTRRFAVKNLREFGFGKKQTMESLIQDEISDFIRSLEDRVNTSELVQMKGIFDPPLINSVFSMLCGFRFEQNDPELHRLLHLLHGFFTGVKTAGDILMAYPFLAAITPTYHRQLRLHREMHAYIRKIISDARARKDRITEPRSFVDVFVNTIESSGQDMTFNDENLIAVIYDFFMAGGETTPSILEFLILYLILNPEIQRKLSEEIDSVVGQDRWPSYEDRNNMPYTEAVLSEILRVATVLPLAPRTTTEDTTLNGFNIPKKSIILLNLYDVHMDPAFWGDPEVFRPERFLDEDRNVCNTERLMPFSLGRRSCLGETMARMNLFLFTTKVFQQFSVQVDPSLPKPSTEPLVGITMGAQPFGVIFTKRPRV